MVNIRPPAVKSDLNILLAYKTKLRPTAKQARYFGGCCGAARFVYNWALADRIAKHEAGEKTNKYEQKKRLNALKKTDYHWLYDYPSALAAEAIFNLDKAYQNFFRRVKQGTEKPGFPKFKKRGQKSSFVLRGSIHIENDRIKLPRIGWVNIAENSYLPIEDVKINFVTVSERGDDWYVSVQVEEEIEVPETNGHVIGVDVGVKSNAVLSDGRMLDAPKALYKYEKKLKRLSKELSRRKKGGSNWLKTKAKINKVHMKIADTRKHHQHNISAAVVSDLPNTVVIEDLNVKGMVKNRHLSKAVSDAGMSELHRQITYKSEWNGIDLIEVDRFFPSSKTCSNCGNVKKDLTLADRIYVCDCCGLEIDRDLNAALNLAAYGERVKRPGLPLELGGK